MRVNPGDTLSGGDGMGYDLKVIVVDDDPSVCELTRQMIASFYTWGEVMCFTDLDQAADFCKSQDMGVAIFVVDVYQKGKSGFAFLDEVADKFPMAYEDAIMITGYASTDVVDMCLASNITHLLEKPIRPYALQFAVRSILSKYLKFAKKLMRDAEFASYVSRLTASR